jgi:hypothetical protein
LRAVSDISLAVFFEGRDREPQISPLRAFGAPVETTNLWLWLIAVAGALFCGTTEEAAEKAKLADGEGELQVPRLRSG